MYASLAKIIFSRIGIYITYGTKNATPGALALHFQCNAVRVKMLIDNSVINIVVLPTLFMVVNNINHLFTVAEGSIEFVTTRDYC